MLTSFPDGVPVVEKRGVVTWQFVLALALAALVVLFARSGASDRVVGEEVAFAT